MTEAIPAPPFGDLSTEQWLSRVPEVRHWRMRVAAIDHPGPNIQRVRLHHPELAELRFAPGQDVMVLVDTGAGRSIRRRYSIRGVDRAANLLDLYVAMAGTSEAAGSNEAAGTDTAGTGMVIRDAGPGTRWARELAIDDSVDVIGPRGKITIAAGAVRHVFIGDETALAAFSAMVEALPPGQRASIVMEVPTAADQLPAYPAPGVDVDWTWLVRAGRPAGEAGPLAHAVPAGLAEPGTHVYVAGESSVVAALRDTLAGQGVSGEALSAKAYWGRGRHNASHGEPLRERPPTP